MTSRTNGVSPAASQILPPGDDRIFRVPGWFVGEFELEDRPVPRDEGSEFLVHIGLDALHKQAARNVDTQVPQAVPEPTPEWRGIPPEERR